MAPPAARAIEIPHDGGTLAGLLTEPTGGPPGATWLYVLGHGAGAGMRHRFMEAMAAALAERGVATLRWEMPAMTAGRRRPDPPVRVEPMARSACVHARGLRPAARLVAGGKSMGGRMTSQAAARAPLPGVEGLVFLGFPLHPAGRPGTTRADHLAAVGLPMLFVSGSRDALATPSLLAPVVAGLPGARLLTVDGADHGLDVPKRSGLDPIALAADAVVDFTTALAGAA